MKSIICFFALLLIFTVSCDGGNKITIGQAGDKDVENPVSDSDDEITDDDTQEVEDKEMKDDVTEDKDPVDNEMNDNEDSDMMNDGVQDNEITDEDEIIIECEKDIECAIDGGGPCVEGYCNAAGKCDVRNIQAETVCSDGNFCNGDDECDGNGACLPVGNDPCNGAICRDENGGQCCDPGFAGENCGDCVRFVQQGISVVADGLKWSTGFGSLKEAHDSAAAVISDGSNSIDSCQIWIKEGTYAVSSTTSVVSNIHIMGGFTGIGEDVTVDHDLTVLDGSGAVMDNIISTQNTSNIIIENLTVKGNTNEGADDNYGGGIYVGTASDIVIENIKFSDNAAIGAMASNRGYEGKGGALAVIESDAAVNNCIFSNNISKNGENEGMGSSTAGSFGGAIYISSGNVTVSGCQFSSNQAQKVENGTASGGAVFAYDPVSLVIENNTFDSNVSQNWGGALRVERGEISLRNNTFTSNTASDNGGAIEFNNVVSTDFTGNNFSMNSANSGGAVHLANGTDVTMSQNDFSENEATEIGAGINVDNSYVYAQRCKFIDNDCKGGSECRGGGFSVDRSATGELVNSLVVKNHAKSYGGGVYVRNNSDVYIFFTTISDNTTDGSSNTGSGVHNYDDSYAWISSSIIWGNTPGAQLQNNSGSDADVEYSIIQGGWSGDGNYASDPLFIDPASNNYKPGAGGDAPDNAYNDSGNPSDDLDGNPRPNGSGYDMGCYEL